MNDVTLALRTADPVVRGGHIGTPVALRIFDRTLADEADLVLELARHLETACRWFGADVDRIHAVGNADLGHASLGVRFDGGQAGVITCGAAAGPATGELLVVGSSGVLSWEPDPSYPEAQVASRPHTDVSDRLLSAVRQALHQWVPVGPSAVSPRPVSSAGRRPRTSLPFGVLLVAGDRTHQEEYAQRFAADPRCQLVAVADEEHAPSDRHTLNERLARRWRIPYVRDLRLALRRDDVDIVSVCAEPERRARLAVAAVRAGKDLYLDKPAAVSVSEAASIARAAKENGVTSQMATHVHSPANLRLQALVRGGRLGRIEGFHADLLFAKGHAATAELAVPRLEEAHPEEFETALAKRELANIGVYPLSLVQSVWNAEPRRVWATTGNYFFAQHQVVDVEDFGLMVVEYADGNVATVLVGRSGWHSHPDRGVNRSYLEGTAGVAVLDAYRPRLELYGNAARWSPPEPHPADPMGFWSGTLADSGFRQKSQWHVVERRHDGDITRFLDCLEEGWTPDVTAVEAATIQRILAAAYQSAAVGKAIALGGFEA